MIIQSIMNLNLNKEEILDLIIDQEDHQIDDYYDEDGIWIMIPGIGWNFKEIRFNDNHDQELFMIDHPNFMMMEILDPSHLDPEDEILTYKTYSELMIKIRHPENGMNNLNDLFIGYFLHPDQGEMKISEKIGDRETAP